MTDYYNAAARDTLYTGKAQVDFHLAPVDFVRGRQPWCQGRRLHGAAVPAIITDITTLTFKPETLTSYEAGFKSEYFDHTLRFNGAAYYYDYQDYQALIYTISLEQLIVNADAPHKGASSKSNGRRTRPGASAPGVAYVDAVVKGVDTRDAAWRSAPCTAITRPATRRAGRGTRMVRYTLPWSGADTCRFSSDGNYLSRFWFNLSDLPGGRAAGIRPRQRAHVLHPGDRQVSRSAASVENLADKHYGDDGLRQHLDQRSGAALPGHAALVQGLLEL